MSEIPTYAIIPSNGRPCLQLCLEAIQPQVNDLVLVEGGPAAAMLDRFDLPIIREPELNISMWWNLGLNLVAGWAKDQKFDKWNVVVLNDDALVPPHWVWAVSQALRNSKAAAACSGCPYPHQVMHANPGPVGLTTRLQGYAFILAGEKGVRANEQLKWYFSDDHVDWLSRQLGGMVMIPGYPVQHLYPNAQMTPGLQAQTAADAAAFVAYWGARPW